MIRSEWPQLFAWFESLVERVRENGMPAEITSGLACVHYRLAETTKDCDLWIPPVSLATFKQEIASLLWQNSHVRYRSSLSAPLEAKWLNGGWSSHLIWDGQPRAVLDIFGLLPRTLEPMTHHLYSNEDTLARVKMTQRDKDWPTVHALGKRLLTQHHPQALLFLQGATELTLAKKEFTSETWEKLSVYRPLLQIFRTDLEPTFLDACLRVEQTFWKKLDEVRLEIYRSAMKPYAKLAAKVISHLSDFTQQDAELRKIAEDFLPAHPLNGCAQQVTDLAAHAALALIDPTRFDARWLPRAWAQATLERCCSYENDPQF